MPRNLGPPSPWTASSHPGPGPDAGHWVSFLPQYPSSFPAFSLDVGPPPGGLIPIAELPKTLPCGPTVGPGPLPSPWLGGFITPNSPCSEALFDLASNSTGLPAPQLERVFLLEAVESGKGGACGFPLLPGSGPRGPVRAHLPLAPGWAFFPERDPGTPLLSWVKGRGQVLGFASVSSRESSHLSMNAPPWQSCLDSPSDGLLTTGQSSQLNR